jgi:hypothetical protein
MKERVLVISTDVKKTEEETETSPEGQESVTSSTVSPIDNTSVALTKDTMI